MTVLTDHLATRFEDYRLTLVCSLLLKSLDHIFVIFRRYKLLVELHQNVIVRHEKHLFDHRLFFKSHQVRPPTVRRRPYNEAVFLLTLHLTNCNHAPCLLESLYIALLVDRFRVKRVCVTVISPKIRL